MASSGRIDELRKKFDENPRRYFAPLASEYRKVGDLQQAILICQEHLPQQPGHMSGHIVYGQALFEAGRLDESRAIFETALTLDPENLIALRHLGDIARNSGNIEAAKGWYKRVLEADPRNEEIGQIMNAMAGSGAPPSGAGSPTPIEVPAIPATPKPAPAPAASAPTAELSVEAIQQLAAARSVQTQRPSGARVMPAVPLDSLPTLVPGVPKVPEEATVPQEPPSPPKPRRSSRSVTPLDWNDVQDTPAAGTVSQAGKETTYTGDATDLLEIADITLETKPVAREEAQPSPAATGGDLNLDLGSVFQADPLAITSRPAAAPEASSLEGLEPTSMASATPAEHPVGDLPLLDVSFELPEAAPASAAPPPAAAEASTAPPETPLEFVDVGGPSAPSPSPAAPFVTSTMAELYVQQGHLESALEIYEQLAAQKPDPEIAARIQELRQQIEGPAGPVAAETAVPPMPTPAPEPVSSVAPHAVVGAGTPAEVEAKQPRMVAGPTIREFLLALVVGTADQLYSSNGAAHGATNGRGSIDALFDGLPMSAGDVSAAEMLGIAFDDTVEVPLLFDAAAGPSAAAAAPVSQEETGQRFSLDQFFSSEAGGVAGRRSNS